MRTSPVFDAWLFIIGSTGDHQALGFLFASRRMAVELRFPRNDQRVVLHLCGRAQPRCRFNATGYFDGETLRLVAAELLAFWSSRCCPALISPRTRGTKE